MKIPFGELSDNGDGSYKYVTEDGQEVTIKIAHEVRGAAFNVFNIFNSKLQLDPKTGVQTEEFGLSNITITSTESNSETQPKE